MFLLLVTLISLQASYSQNVSYERENFDGNSISFVSQPSSSWRIDKNYYVSSPNSYRGVVPNKSGDSTILTSPPYDFYTNGYSNILLRFNHICKISPRDIVRIEYKIQNQGWLPIPATAYLGKAANYITTGFNAASYTQWQANDSTALPTNNWWKEETFDLGFLMGYAPNAQIRFIIKHGSTPGTQISYGWLLDNIEITASTYLVRDPIVEFIGSVVKDTVNSTGPYTINAKVQTTTSAPIKTPFLTYTYTLNGVSTTNSIEMDPVSGDSLWRGVLPQIEGGSTVSYSITGYDTNGNNATVQERYFIKKPSGNDSVSVALTSINSPAKGENPVGATPVTATFRNKGDSTLRAVEINWSLNGVLQTVQPHTWTGGLPWDFEHTEQLGTFNPRLRMSDTIVIWVNNPNGIQDPKHSDDTLSIITYGCPVDVSGSFPVGKNSEFKTIQEAFNSFQKCSPTGNITLELESDTIRENWDFSNINSFMNGYMLTITSLKHHRDSVVLRPNTGGIGITLGNTRNLTLDAITVDVSHLIPQIPVMMNVYAIYFSNTCTNIIINNCNIKAHKTSNSTNIHPIFKGSTGLADSIYITNNILDGGYSGFTFPGGNTNQYGKNIVFDSNTLTNQYYYGINASYTDFKSISNNTILSREAANFSATWIAIYMNNANGNITGNRIRQRNTSNITNPRGIFSYYHNYYFTNDTALIANNEIIIYTTGEYEGIQVNYSRSKIIHNSIYVKGSGSSRGIYINEPGYVNIHVIKNNNIIMESAAAYPIQISKATNIRSYDINSNNYYAPTYIGNIGGTGGDKLTMDAWQKMVTTDVNSVRIRSSFIDSTKNLKMRDYTGLECKPLPEVPKDIDNTPRLGLTTMGCYHYDPMYTVNARLTDLQGWREGNISGESDTVKVLLTNTGATPLTNANLTWIFNGAETTTAWSGTLAKGESTTVTLGKITYISGNYTITARIDNLGGSLQDDFLQDDTTSVSIFVCSSIYSTGIYTIGKTASSFTSVEEAIKKLSLCGANGDITLEIKNGTYANTVDLTGISSLLGNNKLTIKSQSGNPGDVILQTTNIGFTLARSNNIVIDGVTIDAKGGIVGIQFLDTCTNVVIQNCILLVDTTVTSNKYGGIYKPSIANVADSIFILNNIIEGGHFGIWLYGVSSSVYDSNIFITGNAISKQSHYGIYLYYTDFRIISNNIITSRLSNINTSWTGINTSNTNGDIIANKIKQLNRAISYAVGISLSNHNNNKTELALIVNNEINGYVGNGYAALALSSTRADIIHNSIYVRRVAGSKGIGISDGTSNRLNIKNNNIIMDTTGTFPIYINGSSNAALYNFESNNYYSPSYIGYAGANKVTMEQWQDVFFTDINSVKVRPTFIDSTINLKFINYDSVKCPVLSDVDTDLEDSIRAGAFTAMGCYHGFAPFSKNIKLTEILNWNEGPVYGTNDTVKAVIINTSLSSFLPQTINWSFNGNSRTGVPSNKTLAYGERDTITLGIINYGLGHNILTAWIDNSQDNYLEDDTILATSYICSTAGINGTFTVGKTGDFKTINLALQQIEDCGVNGNIILKVQPGLYVEDIDLTDYALILGNNKLTITSTTGNAEDVVFKTLSVGMILSQSNNIVIDAITIDATKGKFAIQFKGACTNVVISNNILLANLTTTYSDYNPIHKGSNTGVVDSIFIVNNELNGGYIGFNFIGGVASTLGTNVVFDSNRVFNTHTSGIYPQYTHFTSISNNTILSRTENTITSTWYAMRFESCNGPITNNRIKQQSNVIAQPYGIYLNNYSINSTADTALIANNEVMLNVATGTTGGIYTNVSRTKIINNSIYVSGAAAARGMYIANDNNSRTVAKNNNIVVASSSAYPIYLNYVTNMSLCDLDYNNMYGTGYVGYCGSTGGAKATIDAWQQFVTSDKHSVSVYPNFIDLTKNMDLLDSVLSCPVFENVTEDINKNTRVSPNTTMGAYQYIGTTHDVHPVEFVNLSPTYPLGTLIPLQVAITNSGTDTLKSALISWTANGVLPYKVQPWQGNLAPGETEVVPVTTGSLTLGAGNTDLILFTSMPNNVPDTRTFNDTLRTSIYACDSMLNGTYLVGTGEDIEDLKTVFELLSKCGIDGTVTFKLTPDTYTWNQNIGTYPGVNYYNRIIFTSSTSNAGDVTILSTGTASMTLSQAKYITLKDITIGNSSAAVALRFSGTCSDIEINGCIISANPTTTVATSRAIEYVETYGSGNKLDNIRIVNNTINGGYYNVYFDYPGSSENAVSDITFDNNILTNAYSYGFYSKNWGYYRSISDNTIKTRNANTTQYGIYAEANTNIDNLNRNKIHLYGTSNSNGIYLSGINSSTYLTRYNAQIINNEIIISSAGGSNPSYGISTSNTNATMFHNSIYLQGTAGCYGWNIASTAATYSLISKNNLYVTKTTGAGYPLYASNATFVTTAGGTISDYNNYYTTGTNIAFIGSPVATLANLQTATGQDANSTNKEPVFTDVTKSLEIADAANIICPVNPVVLSDIRDVLRVDSTNIGAYGIALKKLDAMATEIILSSDQSTPTLKIKNTGKDTIKSIEINSLYNGRVKSPVSWNGSIASMEEVSIVLDTIMADPDYNTITAWISNVNGGGLDSLQLNDTASTAFYLCQGGLAGIYTVGNSGKFKTIDNFIDVISKCGVSGAITLAFEDGTHNITFDVSSISTILNSHPLTITSENQDSSLVKLIALKDAVILLGNNTNVTIKDLTINAKQAKYGIQFTAACSNIVIDKCAILANPTTTQNNSYPIFKGDKTGIADSIRITNNLLDGGYTALWFYGGIDNNTYGKNIVLDSNTISNQSHYGIYPQYVDFFSVSYNTVLSRTANINTTWIGLRMQYANGPVIGNSVIQRSNDITHPTGIYAYYYNYYLAGNNIGRIINNEVILNTTDMQSGIEIGYSNVDVIHNSIYITGTGAARGITTRAEINNLTIKNNNIVTTATSSYPISITNRLVLRPNNIDYNNYYAPTYIGSVGYAYTSLSDWRSVVTSDQNSVSVMPNFKNPTTSLELSDYSHLLCPLYTNVTTDILGETRESLTTMGAYTQIISPFDLMLSNISVDKEIVNNQKVPISIKAINVGHTPINEADLGWSINGVPQIPVTWTAANSLNLFDEEDIYIGTFEARDTNTFDIVVWIENINAFPDPVNWNDTVSASSIVVPLIEFAAPFVPDTVYARSFDVYVKIMEGTGATMVTPALNVQSLFNDTTFYDTIAMSLENNGLWKAQVSQQYYYSKINYDITVTDTVGNSITLFDTTYIKFASGSELYPGNNLSLIAVNDLVDPNALCSPDYTSVSVDILNTGENNQDFSVNNITLSLRVTEPIVFSVDTIIKTGSLVAGKVSTIKITDMMPIVTAGAYDLKIWMDNPIDGIVHDDTLWFNYVTGRFALPVDEDFSNGIPMVFTVKTNNDPYKWDTIVKGTGSDTAVKPVYGTKMLSFTGTPGSMSTLSTRQLDLSRTIDPSLTFWYFHDTVAGEDYTDVRITVDGGDSYSTLFSLTKYDPAYWGWKEYNIDLPSFAINQCVIIAFEAMEKTHGKSVVQYIDRILITSSQNLSLDTLLLPEVSACDLNGQELKVVLRNTTGQRINFSDAPMEIHINVTGALNRKITYPLRGAMDGLEVDTLTITTHFDFAAMGDYYFKAYISTLAADFNRKDDTTTNHLLINPRLDLRIIPNSNGFDNCLLAGTKINQEVIVKNNGNMDLSGIELTLRIDAPEATPPYFEIIRNTISGTIAAGDSIRYPFTDFYTVPWSPTYQLQVFANLNCNPGLLNPRTSAEECVNIDDLALIAISNPPRQIDTVGSNINIEVILENRSDVVSYSGVKIHARIEDSKGNIKADISEAISNTIAPLHPATHRFTTPYLVPNDSVYYITVFIEKQAKDNYQQDDTLQMKRVTNINVGMESIEAIKISMEQNIPNPANNSTIVRYNIPESGEVTFRIHSVNGQLLYNKAIQSESGANSIEINTSSLSAGIYIYSMEYKGQRITKRMSIKR